MSLFNEDIFISQLSIDCVIFGYQERTLKVLIPTFDLLNGFSSLPGGFIQQTESIDAAANRILEERTGLKNIFLEQFSVFGAAQRMNHEIVEAMNAIQETAIKTENITLSVSWLAQRFVSIGYYALVDINQVVPKKMPLDKSIDWYNVNDLPQMIIDHNLIVDRALEALRQNLDEKLIGFNLLPDTFTMKDIQNLYETVYDKSFRRSNFQKKILDLDVLERLEKKYTGAANKAPYLYRFKR